jgi:Replication-relaxation
MAWCKGSLAINRWRDIPLLRYVAESQVVTHSQLFEFLRLSGSERDRRSFDWRLKRLVDHHLLSSHCQPALSSERLYSIADSGIACLERQGRFNLPAAATNTLTDGNALHALELNDIRLALMHRGLLHDWIPENYLRWLLGLCLSPYAKAYDAVIQVDLEGEAIRFALEYERSQKSLKEYSAIREAIEGERGVALVLYLVSHPSVSAVVARCFFGSQARVYFGFATDFKESLLDTRVSDTGRVPLCTLRQALEQNCGLSVC